MGTDGISRLKKMISGKKRELFLYLVFGMAATLVNLSVFAVTVNGLGISELIGNVIAWILSVLFAYITNKVWVFDSKTKGIKAFAGQMLMFFAGRVATLVVEELLIFIFIVRLDYNKMIVKICAQIVVIVLNYVISKVIVFRKRK